MKRKVIQIANSTQLISLPRKWAKAQGIQKGDELDVEMDGATLIVSIEKLQRSEQRKFISVDITGLGVMAKRLICALYRAGYDEIIVKFKDYKELEEAQIVVREGTIGYELIDQGPNYAAIRNVSETVPQKVEILVKRIVMFVATLSKETLNAANSMDENQLRFASKIDFSINKFRDFFARILNATHNKDYQTFYPIVLQLEDLGDEYKKICQYLLEEKKKPSKTTLILLERVNEFTSRAYNLIFKCDMAFLKEGYKERKELNKKIKEAIKKAPRYDLSLLCHLQNIVNIVDSLDNHVISSDTLNARLRSA